MRHQGEQSWPLQIGSENREFQLFGAGEGYRIS